MTIKPTLEDIEKRVTKPLKEWLQEHLEWNHSGYTLWFSDVEIALTLALAGLDAQKRVAELEKERNEVKQTLAYYASSECWLIRNVEGPDGDYGTKARNMLEKMP